MDEDTSMQFKAFVFKKFTRSLEHLILNIHDVIKLRTYVQTTVDQSASNRGKVAFTYVLNGFSSLNY